MRLEDVKTKDDARRLLPTNTELYRKRFIPRRAQTLRMQSADFAKGIRLVWEVPRAIELMGEDPQHGEL